MFDVFGLSDTPRSPPPRDIFTLKVPCGHFGETFVKVMKLVCNRLFWMFLMNDRSRSVKIFGSFIHLFISYSLFLLHFCKILKCFCNIHTFVTHIS